MFKCKFCGATGSSQEIGAYWRNVMTGEWIDYEQADELNFEAVDTFFLCDDCAAKKGLIES